MSKSIDGSSVILKYTTNQVLQDEIADIVNTPGVINPSVIDHNGLQNYVATEHIDWTNTTQPLNTTASLTGNEVVAINEGLTQTSKARLFASSNSRLDLTIDENNDTITDYELSLILSPGFFQFRPNVPGFSFTMFGYNYNTETVFFAAPDVLNFRTGNPSDISLQMTDTFAMFRRTFQVRPDGTNERLQVQDTRTTISNPLFVQDLSYNNIFRVNTEIATPLVDSFARLYVEIESGIAFRVRDPGGSVEGVLSVGTTIGSPYVNVMGTYTNTYTDPRAFVIQDGLDEDIVIVDTTTPRIDILKSLRYTGSIPTAGYYLQTNADGDASWQPVSGETNDAVNVGTGLGVFKQKNDLNLEFNSLIGGTGVSIIDSGDDLTFSVDTGDLNHDDLSNISVNEHIDHSTISLVAGAGISPVGLGDLTTSRTIALTNTGVLIGNYGSNTTVPQINIDAQGRVTIASDVDISHNNLFDYVFNEHIDHSSISLVAGAGISPVGLGDLTTSRTIALTNTGVGAGSFGSATQTPQINIDAQGRITTATNTNILHNNLTDYVPSEHIDWTSTGGATDDFKTTGEVECNTLQVVAGATPGYVLTSDASGNASWFEYTLAFNSGLVASPPILGTGGVPFEFNVLSGTPVVSNIIFIFSIIGSNVLMAAGNLSITDLDDGAEIEIYCYLDNIGGGVPFDISIFFAGSTISTISANDDLGGFSMSGALVSPRVVKLVFRKNNNGANNIDISLSISGHAQGSRV